MRPAAIRRAAWLAVATVPVATGLLAFAVGTGWSGVVLFVHGCAGLAAAALFLRRAGTDRRPSVRLAALVLAAAAGAGVLTATGVVRSAGGYRLVPVHVALGFAALVSAAAATSVWRRRRRVKTPGDAPPLAPPDAGRRRALEAGLVAGAVAVRAAIGGATQLLSLPGRRRRFTGSYQVPTAGGPAAFPATQWLHDRPPTPPSPGWRLTVRSGQTTTSWGYEQLGAFHDRVQATLDCTSGWYSTNWWEGVRLDRLLTGRGTWRSVAVRSATGYRRRFPIGDLGHLMLATRVDGQVLDRGHGYPLRLVAPGRRGFWWVKWVDAIELSETPWWWQLPFPPQ